MLDDIPDEIIRSHIIPALSVEDQIKFASLSKDMKAHVEQSLEKDNVLLNLCFDAVSLPGNDSSWIRFKHCLKLLEDCPEDEEEKDHFLGGIIPAEFRSQCYFIDLTAALHRARNDSRVCEKIRKKAVDRMYLFGNVHLAIALRATFNNDAEFIQLLREVNAKHSYDKVFCNSQYYKGDFELARFLLPYGVHSVQIFASCMEDFSGSKVSRKGAEVFVPYLKNEELETYLITAIVAKNFAAFQVIFSRIIAENVRVSYKPLLWIAYLNNLEAHAGMMNMLSVFKHDHAEQIEEIIQFAIFICSVKMPKPCDNSNEVNFLDRAICTNSEIEKRLREHQPSILLLAAKALKPEIVNYLLEKMKLDPNATDREGRSALMYLASNEKFQRIKYSISFMGVPISHASIPEEELNAAEAVGERLLAAGANVRHSDNSGKSVGQYFREVPRSLKRWFKINGELLAEFKKNLAAIANRYR